MIYSGAKSLFDTDFISDRSYFLLLAAVSAFVLFSGIAFLDMRNGDEYRVAGIGAEMFFRGEWLLPRLNGTAFMEYPPLYYVADVLSYRIFGINHFAAKFPSALAGWFGVLTAFACIRSLGFGGFAAFCGGLTMTTCLQYISNSMLCRVDIMLAFFSILAWWGASEALVIGRRRFCGVLLMTAGFSGAVLTKNLAGVTIPLSGIGTWLVLDDIFSRKIRFSRYILLGIATLGALAVYGGYAAFLLRKATVNEFYYLVVKNNLGRFSGGYAEHVKPFYYYLTKIFEQFQPHLIVLFAAMYTGFKKLRQRYDGRWLWLMTVILMPFILLSISSGKRQVYLLPLAVPCAMLSGVWWAAALQEFLPRFYDAARICGRAVETILIMTGLLSLPVSAAVALWPGDNAPFSAFFALPGAIAAAILRRARRCKASPAARFVMSAVVFTLIAGALSSVILTRRSKMDSYDRAFAVVKACPGRVFLENPPERISGAANFYLLRNVECGRLDSADLRPGDIVIASRRKVEAVLSSGRWRMIGFGGKYALALRIR